MAPRKTKSNDGSLQTALSFCKLAQRETASPLSTFCQLSDNYATSSDGILTASHPIEEDLEARPHTAKLLSALSSCGKTLSITQLKNNTLTVKSGKLFFNIPCHDAEICEYEPDRPVAGITNAIRDGFNHIGHLTKMDGKSIVQSSILLQNGSMMSTNESALLEYWHGVDLPTIVIPKAFSTAICKVTKDLKSIGVSNNSVTFWFDDESWIKTQLFADPWPDLSQALVMPNLIIDKLPPKFWKGLSAVEDFSENGKEKGIVHLSDKGIASHGQKDEGASYEMEGLGKITLGIRQLKNIQSSCDKIAFDEKRILFFGENVRGVLMAVDDGYVEPDSGVPF